MTALNVLLERFSDMDGEESSGNGESVYIQQAKAAAYSEGFAAGEKAAALKLLEQHDFLLSFASEITEKIANIPNNINADLCNALVSIIQKVFPTLANGAFYDEAIKALSKLPTEAMETNIAVAVAPERYDETQHAIHQMKLETVVNVEADPKVSDLTFSAHWNCGGCKFDLNESIKDCILALEQAVEKIEKRA